MNIREMQYRFGIRLNQFVENPNINSDDIEYYLNISQEEYVKQQHFIIRDGYRNQQVDSINIQKAVENLRTVIHSYSFTNLTDGTNIENSYLADISTVTPEYSYYLRSRFKSNGELLNCKVIDPVEINKYALTKHNRPLFREPGVIIEGDNLTVIYPMNVVIASPELELHYISNLTEVSIKDGTDCILPSHTHNEIIEIAVNNTLQDLQKAIELGITKQENITPSQRES